MKGNYGKKVFDTREVDGYTEDFEDINLNYPTTDDLDNMDVFLSHYLSFVNKVDERFVDTDPIALYTVYLNTMRG